jgi:hypothetical protein
MKKRISFLLFILIATVSFSQIKTHNKTKNPVSIYTINYKNSFKNNYFLIHKSLNLKAYRFATLSFQDIDRGILTASNLFSNRSLAFIEDDIKNYRDQHLLKGFLLKNDPTRWSICNFIPQNRFD